MTKTKTKTAHPSFDRLIVEPTAVATELLDASVRAGKAWADAYLDTIDRAAEAQVSVVRETPFEPLAVALTGPAELTRRVVRTYVATGERWVEAGREALGDVARASADAAAATTDAVVAAADAPADAK